MEKLKIVVLVLSALALTIFIIKESVYLVAYNNCRKEAFGGTSSFVCINILNGSSNK